MQGTPLTDVEQIEIYISSSIKIAFARVSGSILLWYYVLTFLVLVKNGPYLWDYNLPSLMVRGTTKSREVYNWFNPSEEKSNTKDM